MAEVEAKTKGHAALLATGVGVRELGRRIGSAPPVALRYLRGDRVPARPARQALLEAYGIPVEDWECAPDGAPLRRGQGEAAVPTEEGGEALQLPLDVPTKKPRQVYTEAKPRPMSGDRTYDSPQTDSSLREQARYTLEEIRGLRRTAEDQGRADMVIKLLAQERQAIMDLAKFSRELTPADESKLAESSAWVDLRDRMVRALQPFPEARLALIEALGEYS